MFIAGNWKLNCNIEQSNSLASQILRNLNNKKLNCKIALFPPFTSLYSVSSILKNSKISIGGQDCSEQISGAFTGDISAEMLIDIGCKYVIVGHSERRIGHNETDKKVKQKAMLAQEQGLISIICVGETLLDRELGEEKNIIKNQLMNSVPENSNNTNCIIAYEPVWAIGSGITPKISEIVDMLIEVKQFLGRICKNDGIKILYGGSVNKTNSREILSNNAVNGALIGGASLNAEEFCSICININNNDGKMND